MIISETIGFLNPCLSVTKSILSQSSSFRPTRNLSRSCSCPSYPLSHDKVTRVSILSRQQDPPLHTTPTASQPDSLSSISLSPPPQQYHDQQHNYLVSRRAFLQQAATATSILVLTPHLQARAETSSSSPNPTAPFKSLKDVSVEEPTQEDLEKVVQELSEKYKQSDQDNVYLYPEWTLPLPLKNTYCIVRHGQAYSNVRKVNLGKRDNDDPIFWGLTPKGETQAYDASVQVTKMFQEFTKSHPESKSKAAIYSSDFSRTLQTATILFRSVISGLYADSDQEVDALALQDLFVVSPLLRERNFDELDFKSVDIIKDQTWAHDRQDPSRRFMNVESVNEILTRMIKQINEIEEKREGYFVVLVSHGDPIELLLNYARGACPSERDFGLYKNCQVTPFEFKKPKKSCQT